MLTIEFEKWVESEGQRVKLARVTLQQEINKRTRIELTPNKRVRAAYAKHLSLPFYFPWRLFLNLQDKYPCWHHEIPNIVFQSAC